MQSKQKKHQIRRKNKQGSKKHYRERWIKKKESNNQGGKQKKRINFFDGVWQNK